LAGRA